MTDHAARAREIVGCFTFGPGVEDAVVDSINEAMETIRDRITQALRDAERAGLRRAAEVVEGMAFSPESRDLISLALREAATRLRALADEHA